MLEYQKLMSEGKNLSLQRCTSLKDLPSRRKQRENNREHVAEKLQRRPPKFNQFSQNGVLVGQDDPLEEMDRNLEGWDLLALQTPMDDKRDPTTVWVSGGVVDVSAMWKV